MSKNDPAAAVRSAASDLKAAIEAATAAGYHVAWPTRVTGLDRIAISETGRVQRAAEPSPEPSPAAGRKASPAKA